MRVVRGYLRGQTVSISDCIATWKQVYGVSERAVTAWPVWAPLALAMACGKWHGDVTPLHRREKGGRSTLPTIWPFDRLVRYFIIGSSAGEVSPPPAVEVTQTEFQTHSRKRGFIVAYSTTSGQRDALVARLEKR